MIYLVILKTKRFLTLCINIALYESLGYKKTTKLYPNVLELFGGYAEINLETTRTKLTPSKKIFIKMIWIIPYCLILVIF